LNPFISFKIKLKSSHRRKDLSPILELINKIYSTNKEILSQVESASSIHDESKKADMLCNKVKTKMDKLREYVDELENLVDDELWPLPKFSETLFIS
jgi:glutamine synthetase